MFAVLRTAAFCGRPEGGTGEGGRGWALPSRLSEVARRAAAIRRRCPGMVGSFFRSRGRTIGRGWLAVGGFRGLGRYQLGTT